jgi:DNA repair protein RadC
MSAPRRLQFASLRLVRERPAIYRRSIRSSRDVAEVLMPHFGDLAQETFVVLGMDTRNMANLITQVGLGGCDGVTVDPKIIVGSLLLSASTGCILIHNHPSGDPSPSAEDHALTRRMAEVFRLLGIRFLDHVILGEEGRLYSFADAGTL